MMSEELYDTCLLLVAQFLLCLLVLYLRQTDTREDHGDTQDDDTQDGIRYYDVSAVVCSVEEELAYEQRGRR